MKRGAKTAINRIEEGTEEAKDILTVFNKKL